MNFEQLAIRRWYIAMSDRATFDVGQVCLNGHKINASSKRRPEFNSHFCKDCGESTITACPKCGTQPLRDPVRGPLARLKANHVPMDCDTKNRTGPEDPVWAVRAIFDEGRIRFQNEGTTVSCKADTQVSPPLGGLQFVTDICAKHRLLASLGIPRGQGNGRFPTRSSTNRISVSFSM